MEDPVGGIGLRLEGGFELVVMFAEDISDWMVCSSMDTLGSQELHGIYDRL